jgi:hypothetical protein
MLVIAVASLARPEHASDINFIATPAPGHSFASCLNLKCREKRGRFSVFAIESHGSKCVDQLTCSVSGSGSAVDICRREPTDKFSQASLFDLAARISNIWVLGIRVLDSIWFILSILIVEYF